MTTDLIKLAREIERENYSHNDVALLAQGYLDARAEVERWEDSIALVHSRCSMLEQERDAAIARAEAAEAESERLTVAVREASVDHPASLTLNSTSSSKRLLT